MPEDPNSVTKYITSPFSLDKAKLTRILNIMEDRFKEASLPFEPKFEITHTNGKKINLTAVEDLFSLDNTVRNPVTELEVKAIARKAAHEDPNVRSKDDVRMQCSFKFDSDMHHNIYLYVKAEKGPKLSNQIFAELEEQIERTFLNSWIYRYFKSNKLSFIYTALMLPLVFFGLASLFSSDPWENHASSAIVNESQYFLEKSKQATTTETKVDFLFEYQRRKLEKEQELIHNTPRTGFDFSRFINWRNFFIILPILIIIACITYVISYCYPRTVFLWGDYETYYKELMGKKRNVWLVVIASLVLGIIGELFIFGLSGYVKV